MSRPFLIAIMSLVLTACSSTSLPYKPEQQPRGAAVSAAYQVVGDRLRVEIDTDGRRLEEAKILRPDGSGLQAQTIEHPPLVYGGYPAGGAGIGIGVGGVSGGRHGVGVGTGVSVGVPVGGPSRAEGRTLAYFPLDQAGSAPWRLQVKLAGVEPVIILLGS